MSSATVAGCTYSYHMVMEYSLLVSDAQHFHPHATRNPCEAPLTQSFNTLLPNFTPPLVQYDSEARGPEVHIVHVAPVPICGCISSVLQCNIRGISPLHPSFSGVCFMRPSKSLPTSLLRSTRFSSHVVRAHENSQAPPLLVIGLSIIACKAQPTVSQGRFLMRTLTWHLMIPN